MRPLNDNEFPPSGSKAVEQRNLHELSEYELPEWLAEEQQHQRQREADDRAKLGIALLLVLITGLSAIGAVYRYGSLS